MLHSCIWIAYSRCSRPIKGPWSDWVLGHAYIAPCHENVLCHKRAGYCSGNASYFIPAVAGSNLGRDSGCTYHGFLQSFHADAKMVPSARAQ
jgi:hypothetical protein